MKFSQNHKKPLDMGACALPWLMLALPFLLIMGCGGGTKNPNPIIASFAVSGTISGSTLTREASATAALKVLAVNLSGDTRIAEVGSNGKFSLNLPPQSWQLTVVDRKTPPTQRPIVYSSAKEITPVLPLDEQVGSRSLELGVLTLSSGKFVVGANNNPLRLIQNSNGQKFFDSLTASATLTARATSLAGLVSQAASSLTGSNLLPVFLGTFTASATVGRPFSFALSGSDPDGDVFSFFTEGTLPAGISLSAGVLSGSPTVSGSFSFGIGANDGFGSVTRSFVIVVGVVLPGPDNTLPRIHGDWRYMDSVLSSSHPGCGAVGQRDDEMEGRYHITQTTGNEYLMDLWFHSVDGFPNTFPITGHTGKVFADKKVTLSASFTTPISSTCTGSNSVSGVGTVDTVEGTMIITMEMTQQTSFAGAGCVEAGKPALCTSTRSRAMEKISQN